MHYLSQVAAQNHAIYHAIKSRPKELFKVNLNRNCYKKSVASQPLKNSPLQIESAPWRLVFTRQSNLLAKVTILWRRKPTPQDVKFVKFFMRLYRSQMLKYIELYHFFFTALYNFLANHDENQLKRGTLQLISTYTSPSELQLKLRISERNFLEWNMKICFGWISWLPKLFPSHFYMPINDIPILCHLTKNSMPCKLSGKTKFSMASCIL